MLLFGLLLLRKSHLVLIIYANLYSTLHYLQFAVISSDHKPFRLELFKMDMQDFGLEVSG